MNIQERKNKEGKITSYRIRVFDHRDAQTGKQVFRTLSVKYDDTKSAAWNKKNAEKQAIIFEKGIAEQTTSDSRVTFDEYCDYAIKIKEQSSISASTAYSYRSYKKRVAPYLGHIQLKKMTPAMINGAYSTMLDNGQSRNSVYQLHLFVHAMLAMAFKEGLIPRNYADAATPPKKEQPEVDALSEEQLDLFFKLLYKDTSVHSYTFQVLFSLLLATGCRIGELCALSWDNVDFDESRIHICKHFITDSTGSRIEEGCKTNAGDRWLYMDDETMDMLKEYSRHYYEVAKSYGSKWNYFALLTNLYIIACIVLRIEFGNHIVNCYYKWFIAYIIQEIWTEKSGMEHVITPLLEHKFRFQLVKKRTFIPILRVSVLNVVIGFI